MLEKHFSSQRCIPTPQMYKAGSITARTVIQQHDTIRDINNPNWCTAGICNKHKCVSDYSLTANGVIFQLYHGENIEMMIISALY
jgi:hypothetical protein